MPIGGAEAKESEQDVLSRFVELCGGRAAEIAIIPTASKLRDTGRRYEEVFAALGAGTARALRFRTRHDAEQKVLVAALAGASGIFLTGGNQTRLSRVLRDTPSGDAILAAHRRGAVVGGTSAGAAVLADPMIGSGSAGLRPRRGMVMLEPGLGLTPRYVVDQHFSQRRRLGRLVEAVLTLGDRIGLGVDEDTAAIVHGDGRLEVVGRGTVTIVSVDRRSPGNLLALLEGDPDALLRPPPRTARERDEACVNGDPRRAERGRPAVRDGELDLRWVRVARLAAGDRCPPGMPGHDATGGRDR